MTIKDVVRDILRNTDNLECDTLRKVVYVAYYLGREKSAREICDDASTLIAGMADRAKSCRYRHMAESVIGDRRVIYSPDYAGDIGGEFGNDVVGCKTAEMLGVKPDGN